ncbi:MAG: hypothetical protein J7L96_02480, partial [Bacteroidales bacterium]|nr:hypothetical protein [Bacteroidales bacterium]
KTFTETSGDQSFYQIFFQEHSELWFRAAPNINSDIQIYFTFQYAFSESDILNGKTYPVSLPSSTRIRVVIPKVFFTANVKSKIDHENELAIKGLRDKCFEANASMLTIEQELDKLKKSEDSLDMEAAISSLSNDIANLQSGDSLQITAITNVLQQKHSESGRMISDIDSVFLHVKECRNFVSSDPIPKDSSNVYLRGLDNTSLEIRSLKSSFIDYRIQIRDLLNNLGVQAVPLNFDFQRSLLIDRYLPVFQNQLDSIIRIRKNHNVLLLDLEPELFQLPSRAIDNIRLDSLERIHSMLKNQLAIIKGKHQESYIQYLNQITEPGPVAILETKHKLFEESYLISDQTIIKTDEQITELRGKIEKITSRGDYQVLWYGGVGLLLLILLIIIQQILRSRKRLIGTLGVNQNSGSKMKSGSASLLEEFDSVTNLKSEFYPFVPAKMPDQVVAEVQFGFRAIKTINQVVSGAITRKSSLDFGGYLFGRQYKATGKNAGQSILFIDQVVSSTAIRPDLKSGIEGSEDLVDELDRIVSQNKQSALLGWYTAVNSDSLEMSGELMKIHRTFFREKWQIAILVCASSDSLTSGLFLKRKSGFFTSSPLEENRFKLEDLYQYVLNPHLSNNSKAEIIKPDPDDYISVKLNGNWSDSIVQKVFILPDILVSLQKDRSVEQMGLSPNMVAGFFYGAVESQMNNQGTLEYEVYISRYVEVSNGDMPREIPGFKLIAWLSLASKEIYDSLKDAIPFHLKYFPEPYQICVLVNISTNELRIFSRKHSLEMNNNIIETEELNLLDLILTARKAIR